MDTYTQPSVHREKLARSDEPGCYTRGVDDPSIDELRVGSKFGVYDVLECIGRGSMGQVYRARHSLLQRVVALKVMTGPVRISAEGHDRFIREARVAATIKHPNVVDILDVGVLDDIPFIVMEFLDGI